MGPTVHLLRVSCAALAALLAPPGAMAQGGSGQTGSQANPAQPAQQLPTTSVTVTVVGTTPLVGVELPREQIPAPVQTVSARELRTSGALDLTDLLNRRLSGVHVNETQGNPFQPDVNYRGYTASPLLGTPQGLSVYMDGVRLNEPFGEIVSWDLIPRTAIFSSALMPGSNPLFGLNTLGGALALQTKDGRNSPGTSIQATYGSDLRRAVEFEHGGARGATGLDWYVAGHVFAEDGWREDSPSTVRQLFGKLGWREEGRDLRLSLSHTDNALYGNGLQESRWLERDYASAYTKPDITDNRSTLLNFLARHDVNERLTFSANLYYRNIDADTLNGDINEESLGQSIYQPNEEELAALAGAGFLGVPDSGATASNTPFPSWRCIANVLLNDEPGERCNGLINRTDSQQHNAGASGQVTRRHAVGRGGNQITVGASYDRSTVGFSQSTEIGHLAPDRSVIGTGAFADGITGGFLDDEPFDARVRLNGVVQTWSAFATDTISLGTAWHVTLSGRFNRTSVTNRDRIDPGGGPGSLDGHHVFSRFNPAAGVTFSPSRSVNLYAGYNEGSRAATSIELGCADPEQPCRLPNAMASDPGLDPVITRTVEAGLRGWHRGVSWRAGLFRAVNSDDILFVTSEQTGFGYFRNFGETRRQGLELGATAQMRRLQLGVGYTFLDATFQSEETVNGDSNSTNDAAREGNPGLEGAIQIEPGHRMPFAPRHTLKIFAEVQVTGDLVVDADLTGASRSYARGNENNQHEPDGIYYLGPGGAPGYAVVNLGARYRLTRRLELLGQIGNLLDRRYFTAAQLGPLGFTDTGAFIARPLPETDGEFPLRHATFYAPGAPIRAWIGTRVTF